MGKGQILSGGTDGFYNLKLLMKRERAENALDRLNAEITRLNDDVIPQLETEQSNAATILNEALAALDTAITAYKAGEITRDELMAAVKARNSAQTAYQSATYRLKDAQLKKDTYSKQVDYLTTQTGTDPEVNAWCADLTEDLSGIVGTIEIPNERQKPVMIRPGYSGRATYDFRRDGQLQSVMSMTPAQALYNCMMFPGWQKWMPTYRIGTITERYIAGDNFIFDVALEIARSTALGLNVNASDKLYQVPAEYMITDSLAFEIGDQVIIEFTGQDYLNPKIIGFKSNPRRCEAVFWMKITRDDGEIVTDAMEFGADFNVENSSEEEADYINADFDGDPLSPTYGYWRILAGWNPYQEIDPDGYWVTVTCDYSIITQYPYRYKSADKHQAGDRIAPGIYQMALPYWSVEEENTLTGGFASYEEERHKQLTVKSSVPYRLNYYIVPTELRDNCWLVPKFTGTNIELEETPPSGMQSHIYLDWLSYNQFLPCTIPQPSIDLKIDGELLQAVTQYVSSLPAYDEYAYKDPNLTEKVYSFAVAYKNINEIDNIRTTTYPLDWYSFTATSGEYNPPYLHAENSIILFLEIEYDY